MSTLIIAALSALAKYEPVIEAKIKEYLKKGDPTPEDDQRLLDAINALDYKDSQARAEVRYDAAHPKA